jgi:hypothetical protein
MRASDGSGVVAAAGEVDAVETTGVATGAPGAPARFTSKRLGPFGVTAVRVPVLLGETVLVLAGGAKAAPLDDFAFASVSEVTAGVESHAVISRTRNSPAAVTTRDIL